MPAIPSFPSVNVTGVIHHWIRVTGVTGTDDVYYLGTAEVTPQMQRRKYKQGVKNDIAGKTLDFQKTYDGEAATVSVMLNRFSNTAWGALLEADASAGGLIPVAGTESRWARGALEYGQLTFEVWQVYDNSLAPAGVDVGNNLEIGWYWPQVGLLDHDTPKAGTQSENLLLVLDMTPYWIPYSDHSGTYGPAGGWLLYSNDESYFPTEILTPQ